MWRYRLPVRGTEPRARERSRERESEHRRVCRPHLPRRSPPPAPDRSAAETAGAASAAWPRQPSGPGPGRPHFQPRTYEGDSGGAPRTPGDRRDGEGLRPAGSSVVRDCGPSGPRPRPRPSAAEEATGPTFARRHAEDATAAGRRSFPHLHHRHVTYGNPVRSRTRRGGEAGLRASARRARAAPSNRGVRVEIVMPPIGAGSHPRDGSRPEAAQEAKKRHRTWHFRHFSVVG